MPSVSICRASLCKCPCARLHKERDVYKSPDS